MNDHKICRLLLGDDYENSDIDMSKELDKYILPHLFIPETIMEQKTYIMLETYCKGTYGQTKTMQIIIQAICHKDISEYKEKPKDYYGLRYDVLAQYIEELLCPDNKEERNKIIKKFGIGSLELKDVDIFLTDKYIGRTLTFSVPDFR